MCNLLDGLVALGCIMGCEGHGSTNGLPQPRMELAERSHEQTYLGRYCIVDGAKLFEPFIIIIIIIEGFEPFS